MSIQRLGKEVLMINTKDGNPRNGEGTFARLTDGRIMHVYTEYYGTDWADNATARLCAVYSSDEGEHFSERVILIEKGACDENIMSPSLFRLPNGKLGLVYLVKRYYRPDFLSCMPVFRYSENEGETWSDIIPFDLPEGYYCAINDGVCVLRDGRILCAASSHPNLYDTKGKNTAEGRGFITLSCSCDNGKSWHKLPVEHHPPFYDLAEGFSEPGVFEREDGALWMWWRTQYGFQYESRSLDGGKTWSPLLPNFCFTSPNAPMRVKKIGDYVLALFNPVSYSCLTVNYPSRRASIPRTPLVCAVSRDDGRSFDTTGKTYAGGAFIPFSMSTVTVEDDPCERFCYPSLIEVKDGFLLGYYHSNRSSYTLNSTRILKITFDELEAALAEKEKAVFPQE